MSVGGSSGIGSGGDAGQHGSSAQLEALASRYQTTRFWSAVLLTFVSAIGVFTLPVWYTLSVQFSFWLPLSISGWTHNPKEMQAEWLVALQSVQLATPPLMALVVIPIINYFARERAAAAKVVVAAGFSFVGVLFIFAYFWGTIGGCEASTHSYASGGIESSSSPSTPSSSASLPASTSAIMREIMITIGQDACSGKRPDRIVWNIIFFFFAFASVSISFVGCTELLWLSMANSARSSAAPIYWTAMAVSLCISEAFAIYYQSTLTGGTSGPDEDAVIILSVSLAWTVLSSAAAIAALVWFQRCDHALEEVERTQRLRRRAARRQQRRRRLRMEPHQSNLSVFCARSSVEPPASLSGRGGREGTEGEGKGEVGIREMGQSRGGRSRSDTLRKRARSFVGIES